MNNSMMFIDQNVRMTSRSTEDCIAMRQNGIVTVIEPALWKGRPRTKIAEFKEYFNSLIEVERFRASLYGIAHYCTIGLNPKETFNVALADQVMEQIAIYGKEDGVVGIGEIGYEDQTIVEDKYFRLQLELAKKMNLPVQIHSPEKNKKAGTIRSLEVCMEHKMDPRMVMINQVNEETVNDVLDRGFFASFAIYPPAKAKDQRMLDFIRLYGSDCVIINSSSEQGIVDPLAVPRTAALLLKKGYSECDIRKVCYENALVFFGQSGQIDESEWLSVRELNSKEKKSTKSFFRGEFTQIGAQVSSIIAKY